MALPRLKLRDIIPASMSTPASALATVAKAVVTEWWRVADQKLGASSRHLKEYQRAIKVDRSTAGRIRVILWGTFPNMLEQGMGPGGVGTQGAYDQRIFSLKETTRNIRHRKDGRLYLMVPFQMSLGDIAAIGGLAAASAAQALRPTLTHRVAGEERTKVWGARLGLGHAPHAQPSHATDPLAGLVRKVSSYSEAEARKNPGGKGGTYMKWRVMSQAGKAWMNPGIRARRLAEDVQRNIGAILRRLL